jgi:hypothetical protein
VNRIYEDQEIIILSDKTVESDNGRILTFTDGSSVDVELRRIVNKGAGDIVIKDLPLWPAMSEILRDQRDYDGIAHLIVSGDMNNIVIIPDESAYCTVSLGGADEFVKNTSIRKQGDRLYIETPRSESNVYINMGSIWVNGKRLPPKLDEDFGYIEIKCNNIKSLYINGTGTGDIYSQVPIGELQAKIKGSTSVDAMQIANVNVEISGSGNIKVDQLKGNLRGRISGSGSIDILNGEIGDLDVTVSGSGSLFVGATARTASLILSGSGEMLVAHIVDGYVEQKTGSGFIKVLRKGL